MRATIRPKAIILTKAQRAADGMMFKGCILSIDSEVFPILTAQISAQLRHSKCITCIVNW